jgi:phage-related minor tail protein
VGEGDISIIDCHIIAATPIVLEGEGNRIMNCYLQAEKGLTHFFEVQVERGNTAFGNFWEGTKDWIVKPFREVADLIREMS